MLSSGSYGAGQPGAAAAGLPAVTFPRVVAEFAGPRNRVEAPQVLSGDIVHIEKSTQRVLAAGMTHDDLVLDDERRAGDVEARPWLSATWTSQRSSPVRASIHRSAASFRANKKAITEDRHAAIDDVGLARLRFLGAAQNRQIARPVRAQSPSPFGAAAARAVHDAVDHERHNSRSRFARYRSRPCARNRADVCRRDARQ